MSFPVILRLKVKILINIVMEYVSYFPSLTATKPEPVAWETVMTTMRSETLREKTDLHRSLQIGRASCRERV